MNEDERGAQRPFSFGALNLDATDAVLIRSAARSATGTRDHTMFASFSKPVLAAVAVATAAASLPAAASAQSYVQGYGGATYGQQQYDYGAQRYYDPCDRERQGRTGAGAVIGAGAGAVVGSQLAARGRRTEGSILGGVLGAVIGGSVGRGSSDRCYENQGYGQPAYSEQGYEQQPAYQGYDQGYSQPYSQGYSSSSQSAQVYYDSNGYGPYSTAPSSSYGSYNQGYTDGRQDSRRDRRDGYDRRQDDYRGQVQYSADGRYWYDPQYGWRPR
jgi:outer membrane lipoprotein SlyB